jgi:hypothetical protein
VELMMENKASSTFRAAYAFQIDGTKDQDDRKASYQEKTKHPYLLRR